MKKNSYMIALLPLLLFSCRDVNPSATEYEYSTEIVAKKIEIVTNKSAYAPGENVEFNLKSLPAGAMVRYTYLGKTIDEQSVSSQTWTWTPPSEDFRGYMVTVYQKDQQNNEVVLATVGVDVSSDWKKFPRYGFLADFGNVADAKMSQVIQNLNKYHINGIQFYDWHYRHHQPLAGTVEQPATQWNDIANRTIYKNTVEQYIKLAHDYNMKAMFYNLNYGVVEDYDKSKLPSSIFLYEDKAATKINQFTLSSPFIGNILFVDPANKTWLDFMKTQTADVYKVYDFDGFHIDQVGDRGTVYNSKGEQVNLKKAFPEFIEAMKQQNPDKYLAFNAVTQFGAEEMAQSSIDFLYSEVWAPHDGFKDIADILKNNYEYSGRSKNSVLAAYMNYDKAENKGQFNTPGVLLTNAVIFAFGGSHIELGEHMLGKEYFPNNNLTMTGELQENLIEYYDFLTAYQNILRDGGQFNSVRVTSGDGKMNLSAWPPTVGKVATVGKKVGDKQVVHFINFSKANSLNWRDKDGTMPEANSIISSMVNVEHTGKVNKVWYASPDYKDGSAIELPFTQSGSKINIKLPQLKYWGMLVIE